MCSVVVKVESREGRGHEFDSHRPRGREIYMKMPVNCAAGAGWWLVGGGKLQKNSIFSKRFFGCRKKHLPTKNTQQRALCWYRRMSSVLCRVQHSAKLLLNANRPLPIVFYTRQTLEIP